MMYPRLKLARNLLTDDGVIVVSIDDNEVAQPSSRAGRGLRSGELRRQYRCGTKTRLPRRIDAQLSVTRARVLVLVYAPRPRQLFSRRRASILDRRSDDARSNKNRQEQRPTGASAPSTGDSPGAIGRTRHYEISRDHPEHLLGPPDGRCWLAYRSQRWRSKRDEMDRRLREERRLSAQTMIRYLTRSRDLSPGRRGQRRKSRLRIRADT